MVEIRRDVDVIVEITADVLLTVFAEDDSRLAKSFVDSVVEFFDRNRIDSEV